MYRNTEGCGIPWFRACVLCALVARLSSCGRDLRLSVGNPTDGAPTGLAGNRLERQGTGGGHDAGIDHNML